MAIYKHVLLATDLSPTSEVANQHAGELVKVLGAKFTLVHTVDHVPPYASASYIDFEAQIVAEAQAALAKLADRLAVPVSEMRVELGPVKVGILKVASELDVDLIVLGSHGHHGLPHLMGSAISGISRNAKCDVLTVSCPE